MFKFFKPCKHNIIDNQLLKKTAIRIDDIYDAIENEKIRYKRKGNKNDISDYYTDIDGIQYLHKCSLENYINFINVIEEMKENSLYQGFTSTEIHHWFGNLRFHANELMSLYSQSVEVLGKSNHHHYSLESSSFRVHEKDPLSTNIYMHILYRFQFNDNEPLYFEFVTGIFKGILKTKIEQWPDTTNEFYLLFFGGFLNQYNHKTGVITPAKMEVTK